MLEEKKFETEQYYGKIAKEIQGQVNKLPSVFRLTGKTQRTYFTKPSVDAPVTLYTSGTTLISPYKDEYGEKAIVDYNQKLIRQGLNPAVVLQEKADLGTLMHLLFAKILLGEKINFKNLKYLLYDLVTEAGIGREYGRKLVNQNVNRFKEDAASFIQWVKDYKVKPLAIELMLKSDKWKVATAIDLICQITRIEKVTETGFFGEVWGKASKAKGVKKGDPKETTRTINKEITEIVIVDFKSGRKGFWDKNILQLLLSKEIVKENFPNLKIDGIYNFAPKDWIKKPTYRFENQERENKTIDILKRKAELIFKLGLIDFEEKVLNSQHNNLVGDITADRDMDGIVEKVSLAEEADRYWRRKYDTEDDYTDTVIENYGLDDFDAIVRFSRNVEDSVLNDFKLNNGADFSREDMKQLLLSKLN